MTDVRPRTTPGPEATGDVILEAAHVTKHFTTLASFTWGKLITDDGNPPLGFVGTHAGAGRPPDLS